MPDRRTRRHAATRQEIIDAAWNLARERGLTGWSLRELAEAVDMRAPSLYGYFASKEEIYDAMYAQGYEELLAVVDATPATGGPLAVVRRAAQEFVAFAVADSARLQLLFLRVVPGFVPSKASYALAEQVLNHMREVFADAGLTDPRSLDLYTALVTGLATQQVSNDPGGQRWTRLIDHAMDMFLASETAELHGLP
jgi:AcrR family transcriptional regulator